MTTIQLLGFNNNVETNMFSLKVFAVILTKYYK